MYTQAVLPCPRCLGFCKMNEVVCTLCDGKGLVRVDVNAGELNVVHVDEYCEEVQKT